jgi:hypothetical protein
MTIPIERYYSLANTQDFMLDLMDPKKTPGIPRAIRRRAASCLRHYPSDYYLQEMAKQYPNLIQYPEFEDEQTN